MPSDFVLIYWDANVFLNYRQNSADRSVALDDLVREARLGEHRIVTSTLTITEAAFSSAERESRTLDSRWEDDLDTMFDDVEMVRFVEFDRSIARHARSLIRRAMVSRRRLMPADAVHLASAHRARVDVIHSYDKDLHSLGRLVSITVAEPATDRPSLPGLFGPDGA